MALVLVLLMGGVTPAWSAVTGTLTATKGTVAASVDLSWTAMGSGTVTYEIYRSLGLNGSKSLIATTTATTYSDTATTQGVTTGAVYGYYIKVAGASEQTNTDYGYRTPATTALTGSDTYTKITTRPYFSLALKANGQLYAAGINNYGQLGNGTYLPAKIFKPVLTDVQDMLAASNASYALKTDGTLWAVGSVNGSSFYNNWQQILSDVSSIHTNVKGDKIWVIMSGTVYEKPWNSSTWSTTTYTNIKQITASTKNVYALKTDGSLYVDSTLIGTGFKKIAASWNGLFAIKDDNTLWAYGVSRYETWDGLGAPADFSSYGLHQVLDGVTDISASGSTMNIALATRIDGSLWANWRNNSSGQYGDGTTNSDITYWKQVADNVVMASAAIGHSLALKTNGTLWAAGQNASGQLGLNDLSPRKDWTKTGLIIPDKIKGVSATDGTLYAKVNISWSADLNATEYDVYRSTSAGTKGSLLASGITGIGYDDTTASADTHYFYTVIGKNLIGSGPDSEQDEGYGKLPAIITGLSASQGTQTGKITLTWPTDPDATAYEIWRAKSPTGTPAKIATATATSSNGNASYDDTTVTDVNSYFYLVKTVVDSLTGSAGNQAEGWANGAPTQASVALTTSSTVPSAETAPVITDPNVTAGQTESFTLAITQQPTTGNVAIVADKFVYTPPADGLFSGDLTFEFTVTDKGGSVLTGAGTAKVVCGAPVISAFTLPQDSIQQATQFQSNATYSLPACSTHSQMKVDVLDSNNDVVVSGAPVAAPNGTDLTHTFTHKGLLTPGTYAVRMTASSDSGLATQTASLTVKAINLPTLNITPGLSVNAGEDTMTASLNKPATVDCPFTSEQATAMADSSRCYVTFTTPPAGMTVDTSGELPVLSGVFESVGSYPIVAAVYKFDGFDLLKIAELSRTVAVSCSAPSISSLAIPALLPDEAPNYELNYKAFACNGELTGALSIKKDTTVIETLPLSSLNYGPAVSMSRLGTGLAAGNYTAEWRLAGSYGSAVKSQAFKVKAVPMPALTVSPATVYQGETRVEVSLHPPIDTVCPLTTVQAEAEADPRKCYVTLTTTVPDLVAGTDSKGLPTLTGYPGTAGDFTVQAVVSRWINGTRYDSEPISQAVTVSTIPWNFSLSGKNEAYVVIETISLLFKQESDLICYLSPDQATAQAKAANGSRACFVEFTGVEGFNKKRSESLNQIKLEGTLPSLGVHTFGYTVKRQFADGLTAVLQAGAFEVTTKELPPPQVSLNGGYKVKNGTYYVPQGQPITRATVTAGVPTGAKLKYQLIDSQQNLERSNIISGSSYWLSTPNLGLLEERPVTLRVAWQDYPQSYSEQVITAIGGTETNMKLEIEVPQQTIDSDLVTVKVRVGKYTKDGFVYMPETMGQWRTQILAQTNLKSAKTPVTDLQDLSNGEATFQVDPAGLLFMKLSAVAELVSDRPELDVTLTSSTRYVEVVKGTPIEGAISSLEGTISAKALEGPAPKTFALTLTMTQDNRAALKEVTWERSNDNGLTWDSQPKSNTFIHSIPMPEPGRKMVRVKMINKNTLVESYTNPAEIWAYSKLDAQIVGPHHVAPGHAVTLAAQLYRAGILTTDTVNEWTLEAPSGKTVQTGPTATMTEESEGKVYVTLRTRPADTRNDDPAAWTAARYYVVVDTPEKPRVSAQGPKAVEVGKIYHYQGTVRPSWGGMESVHSLVTEWQLPDGSLVAGQTLDWSPTAQDLIDKQPLVFRAWVDGFKDATLKETTLSYAPWAYVWPNWSMTMKQLTVQAPSDLNLFVTHDLPAMNRRFEGLSYEWSFPPNVNGHQHAAFPNRATAQALYAGEYDINVTIRDSRGHETVLTQHVITEAAEPYHVTFNIGKSNLFGRAPMTVTVRPTVYGGHPLDKVIGQIWKVDGVPVDDYTNRSFMVKEIAEAGDHFISYTLNSQMGVTLTVNVELPLVPNQPPSCELKANPNFYAVYAEAKCTDPDGKIIGYSWEVNGQPISATGYRISFSKTGSPQSAQVTITAMDDAHALSTPVAIDVNY
ncbi:hypothetical protein [Methylobacter sp. YRD-M1]|uniref:hypothetical protein n=2 Tax=unclassified Methylobacter TaxID=2635283 RepID=UPI00227B2035|nr:hypothetical protein [Methylobacter sp. YRD-M1]WAK04360.1 hypothetical protein LZ558_22090 [Methylobacter sp. YRD-M1]